MSTKNQNMEIKVYPLSHPQMRLWYNELIYPRTALNNIGGTVRIYGNIDMKALEQAIDKVIENHSGLRLRLIKKGSEVVQYVKEYEPRKLKLVDFTDSKQPQEDFRNWCQKTAGEAFSLIDENLFEFFLFRLSENDCGYYIKLHHIIADGWSVNIITDMVSTIYECILNGKSIDDLESSDYLEFIKEEQDYLNSQRCIKNKNYWMERYRNLTEESFLPVSNDIQSKRKVFYLSKERTDEINEYCKRNNYNLNLFFMSVYLLYIHKTDMRNEIIIGMPVFNRGGAKNKKVIGMYVNPVALRICIEKQESISEFIKRVNKAIKESIYNQKYPFDLLMQDLNINKAGYSSFYNICVNYYNTKHVTEWNGCRAENTEVYNGNQIYSFQIIIRDWTDNHKLQLDFDYKLSEYTDVDIEQMYKKLVIIMEQILLKDHLKISDIDLLTVDEKEHLIFEYKKAPEIIHNKTVVDLFEEQVMKTPNRIACEFGRQAFTYIELNQKADQLAAYLQKQELYHEERIGIFTSHSIETIIGILGILKSGSAYVPLVPEMPTERLGYILKDAGVRFLLTNVEVPDDMDFNGKILSLNQSMLRELEDFYLEAPPALSQLCYIIYTSGSTGSPKGTMIEHRGLVNYALWAAKNYSEGKNEVFPLFTSLAFDLTITSIFVPLISGNKIIIYQDDETYAMEQIIRENKATIIKLTPSQLILFKEIGVKNSNIRKIIVGGEDFKVEQAAELYELFDGRAEIYNEYGPTETVVGSMIYPYNPAMYDKGSVPIGKPIDNTRIYLLDDNQKPVPVGARGEIYISGDGLARGYLNKKDLTDTVFMDNPFAGSSRMYRTGDMAKLIDHNTMVYLGRKDDQIKIRGHRIEISEIENCLLKHERIEDAVVIAKKNSRGELVLFAFLVVNAAFEKEEIRLYLQKKLTTYMIPSEYIFLDEIPLTDNKKADRLWLRNYCTEEGEREIIQYRNVMEKLLIEILCDVLQRNKISIKDNFYYIGGDSIKAIQLSARLSTKGMKLSIKDILDYPIVEDMALQIGEDDKKAQIFLHQTESIRTPITEWFLNSSIPDKNRYTQTILVDLNIETENSLISDFYNQLIKNHGAFIINWDHNRGLLYNEGLKEQTYFVPVYDSRELSAQQLSLGIREVCRSIRNNMDITKDRLIHMAIFEQNNSEKKVLFVCHHLAIDLVSWLIILEEFGRTLLKGTAETNLFEDRTGYGKWAYYLEEYSKTIDENAILKWEEMEQRIQKINKCNACKVIEYKQEQYGSFTVLLEEQRMKAINEKLKQYFNIDIHISFLILAALVWLEYSEGKEAVFMAEEHGRSRFPDGHDFSKTIGWFTTIYPVPICFGEEKSFFDLVLSLKEQIIKAAEDGWDYDIIKYLLKGQHGNTNKANTNIEIKINYLGDLDHLYSGTSLDLNTDFVDYFNTPSDCRNSGVEIIGMYRKNSFCITVNYRKDYLDITAAELIHDIFYQQVEKLSELTETNNRIYFTPSDFNMVKLTKEEIDILFF